MITIKTGDLMEATETIIAHQVNCQGIVGGLAAAIFEKWPDAENDYLQAIERIPNRMALLGVAQLTGQQKDGHIICNLYGQYHPGADYRPKDLETALRCLGRMARRNNASVALPWHLSCGICGGDWDEVHEIIYRAMRSVNCVIYRREGD